MSVSSWVNSVEFFDVTFTTPNVTVSINMTKGQNYTNCVPFFTCRGNSNYWDSRLVDVYFSEGVVNFRRWVDRGVDHYVKCYVVEFNPDQIKVQQGSFSLTAGSTTHTITLPLTLSNTNKAAMTFGWVTNDTAQHTSRSFVRGRVVSTTSIDFYRYSSTSSLNGHWFLFEDKNDNFKVTHLYNNFTGTGQTTNINDQKTIDPLRTILLGSYASDNTYSYPNYYTARHFIYSDGTIRWDKNNSNYSIYWSSQIIEILDQTKIYVPMDHSLIGWTSATSYLANAAGVAGRVPFTCNLSTSSIVVAMMQGITRNETTDNSSINNCMVAAELTASGTITHTKPGTGYAANPSYTLAIDWAGIPVVSGTNNSPIPEGFGPEQSFVKSVENFNYTLGNNLGVYVLTKGQIASNCAVFSSFRTGGSDYINASVCTYIKEPGLVYMHHWSGDPTEVNVSVVEFHPNQIKVQHKLINIGNAVDTVNVSIDPIRDVRKAFMLSSVFTPYGGGFSGARYSFSRISFTSTSNVELYKYAIGYEIVNSLFVIEDLGDNFITSHFQNIADATYYYVHDSNNNSGFHNSFPIMTYTTGSSYDYPSYASMSCYYGGEFKPLVYYKPSTSFGSYCSGTIVRFVDNKRHCQSIVKDLTSSQTGTYYYQDEIRGTENITLYNTNQYSCCYCNTTDNAGISESFATIKPVNYITGEMQISKQGTSYVSTPCFNVINWVGFHYQDYNNIEGTVARSPKSFINSLQRDSFYTMSEKIQVWLRYNQYISQCVPFITSSTVSSDNILTRAYKSVYRYDNPDCFRIRFSYSSTANRYVFCYIVEFNTDIKVQYNSGLFSETSQTFTIQTVNLDRAFLHFYSSSNCWEGYNKDDAVTGYFSSDHQITFVRQSAAAPVYLSWYIVECPEWGDDSYWKVTHNYTAGVGPATTVYSTLPTKQSPDRTMYLVSYSTDNTYSFPSAGLYRIFYNQDTSIQMDKSNPNYSMTACNVEAIEFSMKLHSEGLKVLSNFYSIGTATSTDVNMKLNNPSDNFHLQRSMVILAHNQSMTRVDSSDAASIQETSHYLELVDLGDGYSNKITIKKGTGSYNSYGFYFAIQFPKFNKYYMSGYITEKGVPVSRKVASYKTSNNQLTDTTMSDETGYFYLETTDYEPHYVVALDDDEGFSYNHLIYGKIYPAIIPGAFAWVNYDTVYGIGDGVTS